MSIVVSDNYLVNDLLSQDNGVIEKCLSNTWIDEFVEQFKNHNPKTNSRGFDEWNTLLGSQEHSRFSDMLQQATGLGSEFGQPIIISLKLRPAHMGPHSDSPLTLDHGRPYKSYLIPLNNFNQSSTVVFNQSSANIMGKNALDDIIAQFPILPDQINACQSPLLTHVPDEVKSRLSIKNNLVWQSNSILFWNSDLLHCSCSYQERFGMSRDAIVIWTVQSTPN